MAWVVDVYSVYVIEGPDGAYVGVTGGTLTRRWKQHLWAARRGVQRTFCAAIRKHGADAFSASVVAQTKNRGDSHWLERIVARRLEEDGRHLYNMDLDEACRRGVATRFARQFARAQEQSA
jgi:hypothetical protein